MILRTLLEEVCRATRCADCRLRLGAPSHERIPLPAPSPTATTTPAPSCPPSTLAPAPPRPAVAPVSAAAAPPPPPPPHGPPPFATSEPPEIQPKAPLGPFTDVAQIKKVRGRLRNQPDRTSSVAAFNARFVRSRESHVCGPPVSSAKCFEPRWPPLRFHRIRRRPTRRGTISPLAERKELAPVPGRSSTLLCWVFSTCASSSPLEADVLYVARVTRLARPTCCASALPLEERRHVFRVLQKLSPETKGEEAEQGPKEAGEGAAADAEVSAGGNGGPAREHVHVVVPLPLARHTRMVLVCLWNPPRPFLRVRRVLRVLFVSTVALLWRTAPRFPCSADARAS